ncbi:MAG TPA: hypothetical protein VGP88_05500 [Thermoplasmata archaeon]|nr:hypothetical protein [Thermoplasmata archaeon]
MGSSEHAPGNPYATSPGSSTPGPHVSREEGVSDLWSFFWLSIVGTVILVVVGLSALLIIHH